ncbi:MAG: hypothetical protein GXO85_04655 [Chlorobi bacterium]|nr:hypothetical protein [Chlorobiota bacterium]
MKISKFSILIILFLCVFLSQNLFAQNNNSFMNPPKVIVLPEKGDAHSAVKRKFTGIPSLAVNSNGRMWAVWYAGITADEDDNNYVVVAL